MELGNVPELIFFMLRKADNCSMCTFACLNAVIVVVFSLFFDVMSSGFFLLILGWALKEKKSANKSPEPNHQS